MISLCGGDYFNYLSKENVIMKKHVSQSNNTVVDTVELDLNSFSKLEQAELVTRLTINADLDRNETQIALCCVSDLLYDTINQVQ